jgi:predicted helicase
VSIYLIKQYLSEVENIIHYGGTKKETSIRNAFYNLLNQYAKTKSLILIPEISIKTASGKTVIPDGTLKDSLRQDWGYWESKDEADIIDDEIKKKFSKGYPSDNIIFEDSQTAVLFQNGSEVQRVKMNNEKDLDNLINQFINFERAEVKNFRKAIELFKLDIPKVTDTLREMIEIQEKENNKFVKERNKFLKLCHVSINPDITKLDVREMIIQHILTEDIFNTIFGETQFHRENNIAHQLEIVINTFFTGSIKRTALSTLQHYSKTINAAAASIADHHEKQKFLKVVYETFYKSYNPKAADRLGVVYTPNEIVKFMIESTDYLLNKHFGKFLEDEGVEILDPATGTGTFICDLIDYIRKDKLEYKYKNELHANEVAILPYYISNLNIEFTYTQKMNKYCEFENLCFVDTLDNMGFLYSGKQINMFEPFTEENSKRIYNQNSKKISIIIGNPPYNANQLNENDNNKNREYPEIDQRIQDTFIKKSNAQKTKVYDMYSRFYRWAMDRLNDKGIIAFVTNRSFIDSKTFDGFRKIASEEFDNIYIVDLGGDVRVNPKLSGTKHNVFGIQTGVAICFLVKTTKSDVTKSKKNTPNICNIFYTRRPEFELAIEKLNYLSNTKIKEIDFEHIEPDENNNWINISDNDFDTLVPIASKDGKSGKSKKTIFSLYSLGVVTNRDDWVYDINRDSLIKKVKFFCNFYESEKERWKKSKKDIAINNFVDRTIKWTEELESHLKKESILSFNADRIRFTHYRPFIKKFSYVDKIITHRVYKNESIWGVKNHLENKVICMTIHPQTDLLFFCSDFIVDQGFGSRASTVIPFYKYNNENEKEENITDWGLNQFIKKYGKKQVNKEAIFYYVYAVLHNPEYRKKYELNLKRDFPRIPFYEDFKKWSDWGKTLMDLHINYESIEAFPLKEITNNEIKNPKVKLKADKENGLITIDESTIISGIPKEAWNYKLGSRSAIEWVLDQYKEKKPSDKTIEEKFNSYKFSDYKTHVIELIKKVCTVSVETMKIINEMENIQK